MRTHLLVSSHRRPGICGSLFLFCRRASLVSVLAAEYLTLSTQQNRKSNAAASEAAGAQLNFNLFFTSCAAKAAQQQQLQSVCMDHTVPDSNTKLHLSNLQGVKLPPSEEQQVLLQRPSGTDYLLLVCTSLTCTSQRLLQTNG